MSSLHEVLLYCFLKRVESKRVQYKEDYELIYFTNEIREMIRQSSEIDLREAKLFDIEESFTIDDFEELYYDVRYYYDELFEDTDFLSIDIFYNDEIYSDGKIVERLGASVDFYWDILPMDIRRLFPSKSITLTGEVSKFIEYVQNKLSKSDLAELFWEAGSSVTEDRIQLILMHLLDSYFLNMNVYIGREARLGKNKIDILLFRDGNEGDKVLIEIKKASSKYLVKGYEKQLLNYIETSGYKNAFYVIACFTDKEIKLAESFISTHVYTNQYYLYINIVIFDFRIKKPASR